MAMLVLIAIAVAPFHAVRATAESRGVCAGAAEESVAVATCCGEGCTCTPETCACSVRAPTREPVPDEPFPAPSRSHRLDLTPLPAAIHPVVAVGDACPRSARIVLDEASAPGHLNGRAILLQSGVLRT